MLLTTGLVFKSSTDASGRAMARSEIMHQLRAITRQLEQDFSGLRPDMPMAIIFEGYTENGVAGLGDPDFPDRQIRYDRIWFFANGDFQANDYNSTDSVSGNVAHIYYGQSLDRFDPPNEEASLLERRILTRREKILTADGTLNWFNTSFYSVPNGTDEEYKLDFMPVDNVAPFSGGLNFWKNIPFNPGGSFLGIFNALFRDDTRVTYSVVRRPAMIFDNPDTGNTGLKYHGDGEEGFQRLYMASDLTDFKVEIWFPGATEWFPNETDRETIRADGLALPNLSDGYAFYWNAAEDAGVMTAPTFAFDNGLEWRGETGIGALATLLDWTDVWPEALKFTFTLYDKNRRHFGEGETFSYMVKLPRR